MTTRQVMKATGLSEATIIQLSKGQRIKRIMGLEKRNRNMYDIVRDILGLLLEAGKGLKRTHIMYGANLSHDLLKKYLRILSSNGLIAEENGIWHVTMKGKTFYVRLEKYIEVVNLFK